jgi:hypothetical protein
MLTPGTFIPTSWEKLRDALMGTEIGAVFTLPPRPDADNFVYPSSWAGWVRVSNMIPIRQWIAHVFQRTGYFFMIWAATESDGEGARGFTVIRTRTLEGNVIVHLVATASPGWIWKNVHQEKLSELFASIVIDYGIGPPILAQYEAEWDQDGNRYVYRELLRGGGSALPLPPIRAPTPPTSSGFVANGENIVVTWAEDSGRILKL